MKKYHERRSHLVALLLAAMFLSQTAAAAPKPEPLQDSAVAQIRTLLQEKKSRTPTQRKMDSQLVLAARLNRHEVIAANATNHQVSVKYQADGRVLVDMDAVVTPALLAAIEQVGGQVIAPVPRYHAIRALLPVQEFETFAARPDVRFIKRAVGARTHTGSVLSEGYYAHAVNTAFSTYGVTGAGIKVGVLSDSVDHLASSQASGDLGTVTVLEDDPGNTGEGTAMLEIVHDLAPNAALYFATAFDSEASFAQNIINLRSTGCNIIIDDVGYFDESPFQDGIVAQAVNQVTASGALYFSAAGNYGSKTSGTTGTWEGDFVNGGSVSTSLYGESGFIHGYGGVTYNAVTDLGAYTNVFLFWSDPLGASDNDYDLFVLDSTGSSVKFSSTDPQDGSQDPWGSTLVSAIGDRIVVVLYSGTNRFLHLETQGAEGAGITYTTQGGTRGHDCATNAFAVAAVEAGGKSTPFTTANTTETFSSDGLRRMFYDQASNPFTPGNFSSTGGMVLQKPDIAAADGVMTSVPTKDSSGHYLFQPFHGTSAAAPHAGAIAALLWSYNPLLTTMQLRTALTSTALDIMAAGVDRDSGAGIVMANLAMQNIVNQYNFRFVAAQMSDLSGGNSNSVPEPGETIQEFIVWSNATSTAFTYPNSTLSCAAAGVTIINPTALYPSFSGHSQKTNMTAFSYRLAKSIPFNTMVTFTNVLTLQSGIAYTATFSRVVGPISMPPITNSYASTDIPKAIPDYANGTPGTCYSSNFVSIGSVTVLDVNVSIRIAHHSMGDLVIAAQHPDGTEVILAKEEGGTSAVGYGTGYPPGAVTYATFDDQAATPISSGSPPYTTGSYKPESIGFTNFLSNFLGKPVSGIWRLRTTDMIIGDTGTNIAWKITFVLQPLPTIFDHPPVANSQSAAAVAGLATNLTLTGSDPDSDPIAFRIISGPNYGGVSGLDTNSGTVVYTANSAFSGTDTFSFVVNDGYTDSLTAAVTIAVSPSYLLTVSTNGQGTITCTPASGWCPPGTMVSLAATPATYWSFSGWTGDTNGAVIAGNSATTTMTQTRSIAGVFSANLATNQTPLWWLALYGLPANNSGALATSATPGMSNWQKYIAELNPTNPASVLQITGIGTNGVVISPVATDRVYATYFTTNLVSSNWVQNVLHPGTGTTMFIAFTNQTAKGFYRVGVQLP